MSRRGFTLLEMMVATVVMGIAVVGLLSGISASLRNAARVTDAERVLMLARAKMDQLLVDRTLARNARVEGPLDPALLGGVTGGWRARVMPFESRPGAAPGSVALDRVTLEIWWMAGDQRRTFTLDGYRTLVLTPQDIAAAVLE